MSSPAADVGKARGSKGAVYVEFLITFLPMFCFFLCLVQFCFLNIASFMVKHAAEMTARAAIVVIPDDPKEYGGVPVGQVQGKRKDEIERAAWTILAPLKGTKNDLSIDMKSSYTRDEMVEVKITFDYVCGIPFGKFIVCDGDYGNRWNGLIVDKYKLTGQASLPNQGADYTY